MKYGKIINGNYTFNTIDDMSQVEKVMGYLDCRGADTKAAFPRLTSVGDSLDCRGADTKAAFPRLTSVGGSLYCSGADTNFSPKLKQNDSINAKNKLFRSFLKTSMLFSDGILAKIIQHKGNVYKIIIVGKTEISYCVKRDDIFSHGKTILEAKKDLIFKIGNRDTSKFKLWKLSTKVSYPEAIESYRIITGACEHGTKNFTSTIKTKKEYLVSEIIEITKGQWGNETYKNFFNK